MPNKSGMTMDIAIRDIKKNEEITFDYGLLAVRGEEFYCNCRSKSCRKIIERLGKNSPIVKRLNKLAKKAAKDINKVKRPLLKNPLIAQR